MSEDNFPAFTKWQEQSVIKLVLFVVPCVSGFIEFYYLFLFSDFKRVNDLCYLSKLGQSTHNVWIVLKYAFPWCQGVAEGCHLGVNMELNAKKM